MKQRRKLCLWCRKPVRKGNYVEAMGIRMHLECLKQSKKGRLASCAQVQASCNNVIASPTPAGEELPNLHFGSKGDFAGRPPLSH